MEDNNCLHVFDEYIDGIFGQYENIFHYECRLCGQKRKEVQEVKTGCIAEIEILKEGKIV